MARDLNTCVFFGVSAGIAGSIGFTVMVLASEPVLRMIAPADTHFASMATAEMVLEVVDKVGHRHIVRVLSGLFDQLTVRARQRLRSLMRSSLVG
jgi:GTPase